MPSTPPTPPTHERRPAHDLRGATPPPHPAHPTDTAADARAADALVRLAATRPEQHGRRVIGIEGRSGSGKTTFAELVADAVARAGHPRPPVLHMDSLYPGWDGLAAATDIAARALAEQTVSHPTWDWELDRPGPHARYGPTRWLVVEGVGCGAAEVRPHLSALAWLDLPDADRKARALARDGQGYAPHWQRWAAQEQALLARDDIRAHADVVLRTADRANDR